MICPKNVVIQDNQSGGEKKEQYTPIFFTKNLGEVNKFTRFK